MSPTVDAGDRHSRPRTGAYSSDVSESAVAGTVERLGIPVGRISGVPGLPEAVRGSSSQRSSPCSTHRRSAADAPELGGGTVYAVGFSFAVLLLLSVLVHEVAHAAAAAGNGNSRLAHRPRRLGRPHRLRQESAGPWRSILVAAVGPASNAALGIAAVGRRRGPGPWRRACASAGLHRMGQRRRGRASTPCRACRSTAAGCWKGWSGGSPATAGAAPSPRDGAAAWSRVGWSSGPWSAVVGGERPRHLRVVAAPDRWTALAGCRSGDRRRPVAPPGGSSQRSRGCCGRRWRSRRRRPSARRWPRPNGGSPARWSSSSTSTGDPRRFWTKRPPTAFRIAPDRRCPGHVGGRGAHRWSRDRGRSDR